jgi:arabinogalactan endo-1,4-beta-galactosidase
MKKKFTKRYVFYTLMLLFSLSCKKNEPAPNPVSKLEYGGDFSIMKKMIDLGGIYKDAGIATEGFQLFKNHNFTWARFRIFHTPNMVGAVCNNLQYTIASAEKAKQAGMKIFLDFHYSDTWADPGRQDKPTAWKNLTFEVLKDSIYEYTKYVVNVMGDAGVRPEVVQVGNEINNGMLWPDGKVWETSTPNWDPLCSLLKSAIKGVRDANGGSSIKVMVHTATGGDLTTTSNFLSNIISRGVVFDLIGLSYYPWWHGTFDDLKKNLNYLSALYDQEIAIVETAYYANGWYPTSGNGVLDIKPYPPTEQGQYDFMVELASILKGYPKVNSAYYWQPEEITVANSNIGLIGWGLFNSQGNALMGITAWEKK